MKRDDLRLELLKLAFTPGRSAQESIARATEMEKWVLEVAPEEKPSEPEEPKAPKVQKRREP
jgi:hypothetical protein